jgi:hypothetical protein
MGRRKYIESEQDKLDRMQRLTEAIAEIESKDCRLPRADCRLTPA